MKCIMWDFDGTLAYRQGRWSAALWQTLQSEMPGHNASAGDFRPYLHSGFPWHNPDKVRLPGQPADKWWEELEPVFAAAFRQAVGLGKHDAERLARRVRSVYVDTSYWSLFDDAIPCLSTLAVQGWTHIILSNHVPELPLIANALGLSPYISRIFGSAQTGIEKPHPMAFRRALDELQEASAVCMVGDNPVADVAGAEAVGLKAILVRAKNPSIRSHCGSLASVPGVLVRGT